MNGGVYQLVYDGTNFQQVSPTAREMASVAVSTLTSGTTSNADSLHTHTLLNLNVIVGTFTRTGATGTGNEVVTGVGFTPRVIIVNYYHTDATYTIVGSGMASGTTVEYSVHMVNANNASSGGASTTIIAGQGGSNGWSGDLTAVGTDGFTIAFTKAGSPGNITVNYTCLR